MHWKRALVLAPTQTSIVGAALVGQCSRKNADHPDKKRRIPTDSVNWDSFVVLVAGEGSSQNSPRFFVAAQIADRRAAVRIPVDGDKDAVEKRLRPRGRSEEHTSE